MTLKSVMFGLLQFVGALIALYVIWAWNNGDLGYGALFLALAVVVTPSLVKLLLTPRKSN